MVRELVSTKILVTAHFMEAITVTQAIVRAHAHAHASASASPSPLSILNPRYGRINVIELLVTTGGADTSIRANNGTTAREVAELNPLNRGDCPAVARWLQSHENRAGSG